MMIVRPMIVRPMMVVRLSGHPLIQDSLSQPGSDTKSVTTGFPGINSQENGICAHQPQDYC